MSQSLPKSALSSPLNSLEPRMAKASIAVNAERETGLEREGLSLVFETIAAIGMSDKEAAYAMAMDPAQFSRVKAGQGRLAIDALWRMPDRFWAEFSARIIAAKHLTPENDRKIKAARIAELVGLLVEAAS